MGLLIILLHRALFKAWMIHAKHTTHCLAQSKPAAILDSLLGALSKVALEFALTAHLISRTGFYKGRTRWAVPEQGQTRNVVSEDSSYRNAAVPE